MQTQTPFLTILLAALLIPPALNGAAAGELVELAGDGGWRYAGRHAYITIKPR